MSSLRARSASLWFESLAHWRAVRLGAKTLSTSFHPNPRLSVALGSAFRDTKYLALCEPNHLKRPAKVCQTFLCSPVQQSEALNPIHCVPA